jgi:hypothetical protein
MLAARFVLYQVQGTYRGFRRWARVANQRRCCFTRTGTSLIFTVVR